DSLPVPLLVHAPGIVPAGRRVRPSISLLHLAPTILDAVGLPVPAAMEGRSLLPLLRADGADRPAFAQTYYGDGLVGVRLGRMKYVFKPRQAGVAERPRGNSEPPGSSAAREELYDLDADPAETTDLGPTHAADLRAFRARVQEWLADQERRGSQRMAERGDDGSGPPSRIRGDPQMERVLRALGYVN